MRYLNLIIFFVTLLLTGCIGDDIIFDTVAEKVSLINSLDSLQVDSTYQLEARFSNNIGVEENKTFEWESLTPTTIAVDQNGLLKGLAVGEASIQVSTTGVEGTISTTMDLIVSENATVTTSTDRSGEIKTTSSYLLEGKFTLKEVNGSIVLSFDDSYKASTALPGLYVYLTNNPNTNSGAFEIGSVKVFSGAHSYEIKGNFDVNTYSYVLYYCKPFGVKVGDGKIE